MKKQYDAPQLLVSYTLDVIVTSGGGTGGSGVGSLGDLAGDKFTLDW